MREKKLKVSLHEDNFPPKSATCAPVKTQQADPVSMVMVSLRLFLLDNDGKEKRVDVLLSLQEGGALNHKAKGEDDDKWCPDADVRQPEAFLPPAPQRPQPHPGS
ncbi:unnamed protein product [Pleuronectes platessa]|uniref:Uncharacterized protein n=1 Tax=Pleuronectes platessa TaxID=8262 RepID=A0A9N7YLC0_PLEPL|nr:unnamed protein product [Pleuronectes platessa]